MEKSPSYYIWTIGCQMNKAESERLSSYLEASGYRASEEAGGADLIILNGCVVRQSAENRVVNKLRTLKALKQAHPDKKIAVTGCVVESDSAGLAKHFPFVDYFFKAGEPPPWLTDFELVKALPPFPNVTSYVPIMQGCDNFCAYCIVPYRRGRERSRSPQEIIAEVNRLVERGVKEVTLLGQNVDSYGRGLPGEPDLADLLGELNKISELYRVRFLTNHPKDMKSRLIEAIACLDKVCEQINVPVQSGDDEILRAMRRGYTVEQYRRLIGEIRQKVPGIALSTDLIVGFPTESAVQFQYSYDLLQELRFDAVHVAVYSPRPGTLAAREMADSVPTEEKKIRMRAIEDLEAQIAGEINAGMRDKPVEVLVEGKEKGKWQGRTRTDKLVFFQSEEELSGRLVQVHIENTTPWSLRGKLVGDKPSQRPDKGMG